ncbi:mycothiol transferase [Agilicoccus flavus]|uniref:mycothiol transferase n=1 Tax=Agilicoccus flavus TaxID=2775968 RepID=UPI001CF63658|nr:DinB family protein [Agilicoccus flavus]
MTDIDARAILLDSFDRVHEQYPTLVQGRTRADLLWRPDAEANSVGWLLWHGARVQDDHLTGLATALGRPRAQAWDAFADRFALPYEHEDTGYGHSADQVGAFEAVGDDLGELLLGYHEAVHALTVEVLTALRPQELPTVVDRSFDPPTTAATRLVSVVGDLLAHLGQADYVAGLRNRAA